ncbi:MAG: hypothetical protein COT43_00770 [Candidatus Marinimicrobia bacterium CG08_land_8_20_14_0_20_45_22]|nr:MAG: hypothetical protein COT43_00770 [Candidatus Marinimicrobia bacterium CG08_land_8_20_14_0_20_45_22]
MTNLDSTINKISFDLADSVKTDKKKKNNLEKAFGVLANDGVYAFYVFCISKKIWDEVIKNHLRDLKDFFKKYGEDFNNDFFQKLSQNLPDLLFFKDILERILTYTRYHLKALEKDNE